MTRIWTGLALMAAILTTSSAPSAAEAPVSILLKPAAVFTADDAVTHPGWVVLVTGDKITAVGPAASVAAPADARVIDLPGDTLLPGLMDIHSHIFLHPYNETLWDDQVLKELLAYRTIRAGKQATATLMAGFTTLRDLGTEGAGDADVGVKKAIEDGIIPGPRLFVSTRAIVATGAYGPARKNYALGWDIPQGAQEASGLDEVMKAVRQQAALGADWIKLYADYRVGPDGTTVPTFTEAELAAAVEVAHSIGHPVAVHAATDEGMRRAAEAGVDTIEHGYGGTEATFRLMAAKGIAYNPTLTAVEATAIYFQHYVPGVSPPTAGMQNAARAFRLAMKLGVTIGCGSGRGGVHPRRQLARTGLDGEGRHDAGPGAAGGDGDGRQDPALAGPHRPGASGPVRRPDRGAGRPDGGYPGDPPCGLGDEGRGDLQGAMRRAGAVPESLPRWGSCQPEGLNEGD